MYPNCSLRGCLRGISSNTPDEPIKFLNSQFPIMEGFELLLSGYKVSWQCIWFPTLSSEYITLRQLQWLVHSSVTFFTGSEPEIFQEEVKTVVHTKSRWGVQNEPVSWREIPDITPLLWETLYLDNPKSEATQELGSGGTALLWGIEPRADG